MEEWSFLATHYAINSQLSCISSSGVFCPSKCQSMVTKLILHVSKYTFLIAAFIGFMSPSRTGMRRHGMDCSGSGERQVTGSCECINKSLGSIIYGEFIALLRSSFASYEGLCFMELIPLILWFIS